MAKDIWTAEFVREQQKSNQDVDKAIAAGEFRDISDKQSPFNDYIKATVKQKTGSDVRILLDSDNKVTPHNVGSAATLVTKEDVVVVIVNKPLLKEGSLDRKKAVIDNATAGIVLGHLTPEFLANKHNASAAGDIGYLRNSVFAADKFAVCNADDIKKAADAAIGNLKRQMKEDPLLKLDSPGSSYPSNPQRIEKIKGVLKNPESCNEEYPSPTSVNIPQGKAGAGRRR